MLSRLAFKSAGASLGKKNVVFGSVRCFGTTGICNSEERDLVNFPRRVRLEESGPVRMGIFPEEMHSAIAKKTGSTGLYTGVFTLSMFLVSKEYFVLEHEFFVGCGIAVLMTGLYQKISVPVTNWLDKQIDMDYEAYRSIRQSEIDRCDEMIENEQSQQFMASHYEQLIDAKKESVGLQLEAAYRARLQEAYDQVKSRLDFQLEIDNVHRRVEQKHMVNWIIEGVQKSITAKEEDQALKKCIGDLKALA